MASDCKKGMSTQSCFECLFIKLYLKERLKPLADFAFFQRGKGVILADDPWRVFIELGKNI